MNTPVVIARSERDEAIPRHSRLRVPRDRNSALAAPRDDGVWYKQLWPWLLIAPPIASVIGGVALLWIAIASSDGLVTAAGYARSTGERVLTPAEAANCAVKDRACLNTPIEEAR